jgi:hypothetical protein
MDPWLGQITDNIVETTVPSLLVPNLLNIGISMTPGGAIGSCGYVPIYLMLIQCSSGACKGVSLKLSTCQLVDMRVINL